MALRSMMQKAGAAAILAGGLALAGPAMAQTPTYVGVTPPVVGAVDATSGTRTGGVLSSQAQIAPQVAAPAAASGGLAFTGADIMGLSTIGAVSIGIGVIAVRSGRRRSAAVDAAGPLSAG